MPSTPLDALTYELNAERAASLGRAARRLEEAVAAWRTAPGNRELLAAARERAWYYVVQRDAMGWHDHAEAFRILDVPEVVTTLMGPRRT